MNKLIHQVAATMPETNDRYGQVICSCGKMFSNNMGFIEQEAEIMKHIKEQNE